MKKLCILLAALTALCALTACSQEASSASQAETTAAAAEAASTLPTVKPGADDNSEGDDRILGEWSGEQVTTQGDKLADVTMKFTKDGKFTYKATGEYQGDDVEISQEGTYTIDVDVVEMTFKKSTMKNLKTGKETKETISSDDYQSVSGTLTSSTDLYIVSDYGYTISLKKK